GTNDPVDEARFDEWHEAGDAKPGGRQSPTERQTNGGVGGQHFRREEPARLAQPARVVREKDFVDQFRQAGLPTQRGWVNAFVTDLVQVVLAAWHGDAPPRIPAQARPFRRSRQLRVAQVSGRRAYPGGAKRTAGG